MGGAKFVLTFLSWFDLPIAHARKEVSRKYQVRQAPEHSPVLQLHADKKKEQASVRHQTVKKEQVDPEVFSDENGFISVKHHHDSKTSIKVTNHLIKDSSNLKTLTIEELTDKLQ